MAKEPSRHVAITTDEWTFETLRIHIESKFDGVQKLLDERQTNYAVSHAQIQTQLAELTRIIAEYVTRAENDQMHARIDDQMGELKERMNRAEGRGAAYLQSWLILVAAISTIGVVVGIFVYFAEH